MSQMRDIPPIAGAITWARQIERQLQTYMKRVEDVLGKGWDHVRFPHVQIPTHLSFTQRQPPLFIILDALDRYSSSFRRWYIISPPVVRATRIVHIAIVFLRASIVRVVIVPHRIHFTAVAKIFYESRDTVQNYKIYKKILPFPWKHRQKRILHCAKSYAKHTL